MLSIYTYKSLFFIFKNNLIYKNDYKRFSYTEVYYYFFFHFFHFINFIEGLINKNLFSY